MAARNTNKRDGISRARQIATQAQTPLEKAQVSVGKTILAQSPVMPATELPVRGNTTLPVQTPIRTTGGEMPYIPPIKEGKPNQEYIRTIPPPPPRPDPESPITESIIQTEIDKIIEDSKEVVNEVEIKKDPARPPVEIVQDIVRPPAAITPTELVLEAQANCEKDVESPNINIVNDITFSPVINLAPSATASISPVITITAAIQGCTDPDAINYDPEAKIDDASCKYEPIDSGDPVTPTDPTPAPINMPDVVTFVDSHGAPLFDVLKTEVTKTEQTDSPGYSILPDGTKLVADLQLVNDVTRPALEDSDIVLSLEDSGTADRKNIRDELGELASDNKLPSDQDIVIVGSEGQLKTDIVRNDRGIIFLNLEQRPMLNISLRSQAFNFNQYKRTIDTRFTELLGKR
jgi:hypothetical protein|tara:strand:- start:2463 stop:3677 length:1215 start_codon:yes stop_codon:yes gene_type:complete